MADHDDGTTSGCALALALGLGGSCAALDEESRDVQRDASCDVVRERGHRMAGAYARRLRSGVSDDPEFPGAVPSDLWEMQGTVLAVIECAWKSTPELYLWVQFGSGETRVVSLGPHADFDRAGVPIEEGDVIEFRGFQTPRALRSCPVTEYMQLIAVTELEVHDVVLTIRDADGRLLAGGPRQARCSSQAIASGRE